MIALVVRKPEEPLLERGIGRVPQRQREAQPLVIVRDAGQPVLSPAIRAEARVLVWEEVPGRPMRAIVLAHRAPLPLGQVWAPPFPVRGPLPVLFEPLLLAREPAALHPRRHWVHLPRHV